MDHVAKAEGSYSADFLSNTEDEQYVLHVMALQKDMNEVAVTDGRLPEKIGECLADDEMGYKVGDKITLKSGNQQSGIGYVKDREAYGSRNRQQPLLYLLWQRQRSHRNRKHRWIPDRPGTDV